ncbi:hypothetical protein CFY87_11320 [Actinobacillus seminis]|uniref:Lipoprotein n=1 Tax=Actinobacillus seminis TaxID=722 RepID=A0A263HAV1_9PAST|nr:hypothetical protein [Actinobacillus seminis]OZN24029.1 hypothetical protein CFY87_11320 [Actinobacillus seminis]SUU37215.1 Uncharacterised protein [Actinobacillus seminis]
MRLIIVLFMSIFILSGCPFSSNSYFVRWWNGNLPLSDKERKAWKDCLDEAKLQYPDSIDPLGKEQLRYERECMTKKGY